MAEYVIQANNSETIPINLISGFIHTDTCVPCGINNQYNIPIPVPDIYDATKTYTVKVRVYDSSSGQATLWTEPLTMYFPPPKPIIEGVYYDALTYGYYNDILYVVFSANFNPDNDVIIAYYYTDLNGVVQWDVTSPTAVQPVPNENRYYVSIPLGNDVDLIKNNIYVAAHAVYDWTSDGNNYYAVSEVTETKTAEPAEYNAPILNTLIYNVYLPSHPQTVTLNWSAPITSDLELLIVDHYLITVSIDGVKYEVIDTQSTSTTATVDVSYGNCGELLSFGVQAVSAAGAITNMSNELSTNVFKFSTAPTSTQIGYALRNEDVVDVEFSFNAPTDTGCGEPQHFRCILKGNDDVEYANKDVTFITGQSNYIEFFNDIEDVPETVTSFILTVSLGTFNTNTPTDDILYGASATATFNISSVPIVEDIVLYNNVVTFRVLTGTLLNLVNNIALVYNSQNPQIINWLSSPVAAGGNVVSVGQDINGVFIYLISISLSGAIPNKAIIVNASNPTGIGHLAKIL